MFIQRYTKRQLMRPVYGSWNTTTRNDIAGDFSLGVSQSCDPLILSPAEETCVDILAELVRRCVGLCCSNTVRTGFIHVHTQQNPYVLDFSSSQYA